MASAEGMLAMQDYEMAIKFRETAWIMAQKEIALESCSEQPDVNGDEITGTVEGDLVINAAQIVTLNGATITGAVRVEGGTLIIINGATLQDKLEGLGGATITIEAGTTIEGDVLISGSGSSLVMTDSIANKKVETKEIALVSLTGNTVGGDIISEKDGDVTITGNSASKVEIKDPAGSCTDAGQIDPVPDTGCPT